jgi:hypothetical protein
MNNNTNVKVTSKWESETRNDVPGLAVIYAVKNMENKSLPELLVFFSADADPRFSRDQVLTIGEVQQSRPYKAITFKAWDDIPNDMVKAFLF